jgi:hypothetical protein
MAALMPQKNVLTLQLFLYRRLKMARTRLNNDKRYILKVLATKIVHATPIDPTIEKQLAKAWKEYKALFQKTADLAIKLINKQMTTEDRKSLDKFSKLTHGKTNILFLELDNRDFFEINLFSERIYKEINYPVEGIDHLPWQDQDKYQTDLDKARESVGISLPYRFRFIATPALYKLVKDLAQNATTVSAAKEADIEKRVTIKRDFIALINGSRTFEDVVEVWPEAAELTDRICSDGSAVSLVSDEAKERIARNMAIRGVS